MLGYDLLWEFENPLNVPLHLYAYTLGSLKTILKERGFAIVDERAYSAKEDGGRLTLDIARWLRHRMIAALGNNRSALFLAWVGKRIVRFYPFRSLVTFLASRRGKSASIAVLCRKTSFE